MCFCNHLCDALLRLPCSTVLLFAWTLGSVLPISRSASNGAETLPADLRLIAMRHIDPLAIGAVLPVELAEGKIHVVSNAWDKSFGC